MALPFSLLAIWHCGSRLSGIGEVLRESGKPTPAGWEETKDPEH
jgi:hypothetical protein